MAEAEIGVIGLGVMGANLALNMAEKGYSVAVYNRTTEKTDAFVANAGSLAERLTPCRTLTALAEAGFTGPLLPPIGAHPQVPALIAAALARPGG